MNQKMKYVLLSAAAVTLMTTGCASSKVSETDVAESETNLVAVLNIATNGEAVVNIATNAEARGSVTTPPQKTPAGAVKPPLAKSSSKPWTINLRHGYETAIIDGVLVYLYAPAEIDSKTQKTKPSAVDMRHVISPLTTASTNAIASGRPLRVFIDPGHGGADPGALSTDRKLVESQIALDISKRLAEYLSNAGFEVMLSRRDNTFTQVLEERSMKAARWKADVFLSIHLNANPSSSADGLETYVLPVHGMLSTSADNPSPSTRAQANIRENGNANDVRNTQLGFAIQRRTVRTSRLTDRGLRRARFVVLREASMPAALIECGFLSSSKDQKMLRTADGRERLARGIYQGVCDYAFGTVAPGHPPYPVKSSRAAPPPMTPAQQAQKTTDSITTEPKPTWQPPQVQEDPGEDPRLKQIRLEAAKAAGL